MKKRMVGFLFFVLLNVVSQNIYAGEEDPFTFTFKNNTSLKFYGTLEMLNYYDTTSPFLSDWLIYVYPKTDMRGTEDSFSMSVRASKLGFQLNMPEMIKNAEFNAKIETDFVGGYSTGSMPTYSPLLRLRQAWISVDWKHVSVLAGQSFAIFGPLFPDVGSWIALGSSGNPWIRLPQLRLTLKYDPIKFELSANRPMAANVTVGGTIDDIISDGEYSNMPFIMSRLGYDGRFGPIDVSTGASGVVGKEKIIRDNTAPDIDINKTLNLWLFVYDLKLSSKYIDLAGEFFKGENLNTFFGGVLQGINVNNTLGTTWSIGSIGGWTQITLKPAKKFYINLGAGIDDPDDDDLTAGQRSYNFMSYGNLNYKVSPMWTLSMEPSYMKTGHLGTASNDNIRAMLRTAFNF